MTDNPFKNMPTTCRNLKACWITVQSRGGPKWRGPVCQNQIESIYISKFQPCKREQVQALYRAKEYHLCKDDIVLTSGLVGL